MPSKDATTNHWLIPLMRVRVWLAEVIRPHDTQILLIWAGLIGFAGAIVSVGFRQLVSFVQHSLTRQSGGYVESFAHLPWEARLLIPALGGLIAGTILFFGARLLSRKSSTDYMEAIVLGDGVVPARLSLIKSASALFSIASGASIGREGPLVQLSAMAASLIGRVQYLPAVRLRLLVACGAAAGIASAYNAPIGGSMFVSEIVLRSISMETFGPLAFASVIATLTVRHILGANPLYEIVVPPVRVHSNWEIFLYLIFGLLAGVLAPSFLRLLRASERAFSKTRLPSYARLTLGGLVVGALAIVHPEVCGNGYSVINSILHNSWAWNTLLLVLVLKIFATAATFGSGAVGGVFTPTLFVGACLGYLFQQLTQTFWPGSPLNPSAFALVGMGAFLAATTHAPIMAITVIFELTLDYEIILPLMLTSVVAYYTSRAIEEQSIYNESLKRKGAGTFQQQLTQVRVADLMKLAPPVVGLNAPYSTIAESFLIHRFNYLYVIDEEHRFKGVVSLHDVKNYLHEPELARIVLAQDIMRESFLTLAPGDTLSTALDRFSRHDGERLPVIDEAVGHKLVASISKSDVILAIAEQARTPSVMIG